MFNVFKKGEKRVDDFLPEYLQIGTFLQFGGLEFSNVGTNSKFIFEKQEAYIEKVGIATVEGIKFVNLYLGGVEGQEAYLQLRYKGEDIDVCKLFVNYDYIYPETEEEWIYWLGKDKLQGIIGDDTFIIDEEPVEKIARILYKVGASLYEEFHNFEDCDFYEEESYISTDIIEKLSQLTGKSYDEVKSFFEEKLEDEDWLLEIIKEEDLTAFYYNFSESDLQTEYYNINGKGKSYRYKEKVYQVNEDEKKVVKNIYEKRGAMYSRDIEDEFFEEEYIVVNYLHEKERKTISIDLGIPIQISTIKKV